MKLRAWFLVLAVVAVNAWLLSPELTFSVLNMNDDALHLTVARGMVDAIQHGQNPIDFWTPEIGFGEPIARLYQPLGHLLIAAVYFLLFKTVSLAVVFAWVRTLLLIALPVSFYAGARLMGFSSWAAAAAALISPLVSGDKFGIDFGAYTWDGWGLYPQLVATHFLLLATGMSWRAIRQSSNCVSAGVLIGCTGLSNLLYGYFCAPIAVMIALLPGSNISARERVWKFVKIGTVGLIFALPKLWSWWKDSPLMTRGNPADGMSEVVMNSYGAVIVMQHLIGGWIVDQGRMLPVLTILAFAGIILAAIGAAKRSELKPQYIFLIAGLTFWVLLYFGRATWGTGIRFIGIAPAMQLHRIIGIVQIFLVFLAAIALEALWRLTKRHGGAVTAVIVTAMLLGIPVIERYDYLSANEIRGNAQFSTYEDQARDIDRIMAMARARGGRVYAPGKTQYELEDVPLLRLLAVNRLPTVKPLYIAFGLASGYVKRFDELKAASYTTFNVRTVIVPLGSFYDEHLPSGAEIPAFLKRREKVGRFLILDAPGEGYFSMKPLAPAVAANRDSFYKTCLDWLYMETPTEQPLNFEGIRFTEPESTQGGLIKAESQDDAGNFFATVESSAGGVVLFRMNYHPHWHAAVDGTDSPTMMLCPGFIGIPVRAGSHQIVMSYRAGI